MKGKFITLEGIEGSGKSTSLEDIASTLKKKSIDYILTKEPGSGSLGNELRSLLLSSDNKISGEVELLLMMADRKNHLDSLVIPNLKNGIWVISSPSTDLMCHPSCTCLSDFIFRFTFFQYSDFLSQLRSWHDSWNSE